MKTTGIVRALDLLGRIVIPSEIRKTLDLHSGTPTEIYVEGDKIILQKFQNKCEFCGNSEHISEFKGKFVCEDCRELIRKG